MEGLTCISIPLGQIRVGDFQFRRELRDRSLFESIKQLGLLQPLSVIKHGKHYIVVDGHKRLTALKQLKYKQVSCAVLLPSNPDELLLTSLTLNHQTAYSDVEKALILKKCSEHFSIPEKNILTHVMPLLNLTPSLKVLNQYTVVAQFPPGLISEIELGHVSFHGSFGLAQLKGVDRDYALRYVLPKIKPSASQLSHLCEWWLDLANMKKKSLRALMHVKSLQPDVRQKDIRKRTDVYYQGIRSFRFPALAAKEKAFASRAKNLSKGLSNLELRAPNNFEKEGFFLHAHIKSPQDLSQIEKKVSELRKQGSRLFDTLL